MKIISATAEHDLAKSSLLEIMIGKSITQMNKMNKLNFFKFYYIHYLFLINEQINPSKDGSRAQAVYDLAEIIIKTFKYCILLLIYLSNKKGLV